MKGESEHRKSHGCTKSGVFARLRESTTIPLFIFGVIVCSAIALIIGFLSSSSLENAVSIDSISGGFCGRSTPSPQDVYACYQTQCTFDVSLCSENCPFGFANNEEDCPTECTCAEKGIFEGDIMFDEEDLPKLIEDYGYGSIDQDFTTFVGSATSKEYKLWNQDIIGGKYIIRYLFNEDVNDKSIEKIMEAIGKFDGKTCLKFERVQPGYVGMHLKFMYGRYCAAPVGRRDIIRRFTEVLMTRGCSVSNLQHEIMHALGFNHEQSRPDRDAYIKLYEDNMFKWGRHNFKKLKRSQVKDLNSKYDVKSRMHYDSLAFSKNRRFTIESLKGGTVGGMEFTEEDIYELNGLYKCPKITTTAKMQWGRWTGWSQCDETCGDGQKIRYRKCTQANAYAHYCEGSSTEIIECKVASCPGEWGEWTSDTPCSQTCGYGSMWMVRKCKDWVNGCDGRFMKIENCNRGSCQTSALWTVWSNWSQCSSSCGSATRARIRFCKDSRGSGSEACGFSKKDKEDQTEYCKLPSCVTLSKTWGSWSRCSATCEGSRKRQCTGGACTTSEEVEKCATRPCKEPDIFAKTRQSLNIDDVCNAAFTTENWVFGDFNGDNHVDIVCLDLYGVYQLSHGSKFGFKQVWAGHFDRCGRGDLLQGDVNGDGKSDLMCRSKLERRLLVRYAADRSFEKTLPEGSDFCTKYSSDLIAAKAPGGTALICHSKSNKIEIRHSNE